MPWFSDDDETAGGLGGALGPGVCVPGLYARLIEHERIPTPDPRWSRTERGRGGEPCPQHLIQVSPLLATLEAGGPVELPGWCHHLGLPSGRGLGDALPGLSRAIAAMQGDHGKFVALMVHADDMLIPQQGRRNA